MPRTYVPKEPVWIKCLHDGKATKGRAGRKFCDTACRTRYHSSKRWRERAPDARKETK